MTLSKLHRSLLRAAILLAFAGMVVSWWLRGTGGATVEARTNGEATRSAGSPAGGADAIAAAEEFKAYAAKLRAQGCPEKTVRELVASRITAAFESRRVALHNRPRRGDANADKIGTQTENLNREQGKLIAQLVGGEPPRAGTGRIREHSVRADENILATQVQMPAVMAEAMPATVKTSQQAAEWEKLRDDFLKAVGGDNQDPADPHYRRRWAAAESEADRQFRLVFGEIAFMQLKMQAQHEAILRGQE